MTHALYATALLLAAATIWYLAGRAFAAEAKLDALRRWAREDAGPGSGGDHTARCDDPAPLDNTE